MRKDHKDKKEMMQNLSVVAQQVIRSYYVVYLICLNFLSGCATATADGIISKLGDPVKEMSLTGHIEVAKSNNDFNIKGVNYHTFQSDKITTSNKTCYILIPYDSPPPKWDSYCWITDSVDEGIEIVPEDISYKTYVNRYAIFIKDTNFQGQKCLAHIKLSWKERSRVLYGISHGLYLIAIPIDLITFPIQFVFSDYLNPF